MASTYSGQARKRLFKLSFLFSLVLVLMSNMAPAVPTGATPVARKVLDVKFHRQNTVVWCWAATIAMVVGYLKDESLEDCEVLSKYDRALGGRGLCCQGASECVRTGQPEEMGGILGRLFAIHGRYVPRALSFSDVVRLIDDDKPIIAGLQKPSSGHVVVIAGYDTSDRTVKVMDPMHGIHWVPYSRLVASWEMGVWSLSFEFTTDREGRDDGSGEERMTTQPQYRPQYRTTIEACDHPAHPRGDVSACSHGPAHPGGDIAACQHPCYDYYGRAFPCHPNGDLYACAHPMHPNGDLYPCSHPAHPGGHQRRIQIN
jgi:hypothetical protein